MDAHKIQKYRTVRRHLTTDNIVVRQKPVVTQSLLPCHSSDNTRISTS